MSYIYPKHDPKWIQADQVVAATANGTYVDVTSRLGNFLMQEVTHHNRWRDMSKGDIVVEVEDNGWFCIWFNMADILPYKTN